MASDLELLAAWRTGDKAAGDALISRHWAAISRFVLAKVGDAGVDLVAQVFLACVEGKDRIAGEVAPYLFAVARRRLADHFRTQARRPEVDLGSMSLEDLAPGPATQVDRAQRADLLHAALRRVPLDDQIALELAYVEGLSTRALAEALELPENTVRSRLSRARGRLRDVLATLGSPSEAAGAEAALPARPDLA